MSINNSATTLLHPRNIHNKRYDFSILIHKVPELKQYLHKNPLGEDTISFADPKAVKLLNQSLLLSYYGVQFWDIPNDQLCPPIPGRADYIHYLADLLYGKTIPEMKDRSITILDVGVGANIIYPIIGVSSYGWKFVGSDISESSLNNASTIVSHNQSLKDNIVLRHQSHSKYIFKSIIKENEYFDAVICNPPFFTSKEEAYKQTRRKMKNLGQKQEKIVHNFGGKSNELWCKGGELQFITNMINESVLYKKQVGWFTSLVSNKDHLKALVSLLKKCNVSQYKIVEMKQGNKQSRFISWKFS